MVCPSLWSRSTVAAAGPVATDAVSHGLTARYSGQTSATSVALGARADTAVSSMLTPPLE